MFQLYSEACWLCQDHEYLFGKVWRPVTGVRRPHRKPLKLRGFELKLRFDCCIAWLLDAGGWIKLRAGGWRKLSWAHLNSGGLFACWFRKVAGWLRCVVWGSTRPSFRGISGFMVWNLQELVVIPFAYVSNEISMVLASTGNCCEDMIAGLDSPGRCGEAMYKRL